jgi:hypothetical protein
MLSNVAYTNALVQRVCCAVALAGPINGGAEHLTPTHLITGQLLIEKGIRRTGDRAGGRTEGAVSASWQTTLPQGRRAGLQPASKPSLLGVGACSPQALEPATLLRSLSHKICKSSIPRASRYIDVPTSRADQYFAKKSSYQDVHQPSPATAGGAARVGGFARAQQMVDDA